MSKVTPVEGVNNNFTPDVKKKLRGYQETQVSGRVIAEDERPEGPATTVEISEEARKLLEKAQKGSSEIE